MSCIGLPCRAMLEIGFASRAVGLTQTVAAWAPGIDVGESQCDTDRSRVLKKPSDDVNGTLPVKPYAAPWLPVAEWQRHQEAFASDEDGFANTAPPVR